MRPIRAVRTLIPLLACAAAAASVRAQSVEGLGDLSKRLQDGDRAAIGALLARTRPAANDLADSNARIERLRAEIERLSARNAARPTFPVVGAAASRSVAAPVEAGASGRVDGLREAHAWLRAGEPERALLAIPNKESEAVYMEARALEKLGRSLEALEAYRSVVASANSDVLRARAAGDVAHLEWRERILAAREGRP